MSEESRPSDLRRSPASGAGVAVRRFGDDSPQPLSFYLFQDVIEELVFAARYEPRRCMAVLTGGFGLEDGRGFIEVTGFCGATWFDDPRAIYDAVRANCDEWIRQNPRDPIVGLFSSLAGSRGRVDEESTRLHYSLFNIPFQPLVMFDPDSGDISVSARAPATALFNAAFRVVAAPPTARAALNETDTSGTPLSLLASEEE